MNDPQNRAILTVALMAAFADGANAESEHAALQRAAESLGSSDPEIAAIYQDVLFRKPRLEDVAAAITAPESKRQAYEVAVAVCDADGAHTPAEAAFLTALARALGIDPAVAARQVAEADAVAAAPLAGGDPVAGVVAAVPANAAEIDAMIVNYAILNGALELLPESLASMAIIPLQMKMVYRIGKAHGFELDRGHVTDFLATVGVGLASQYVEQFGRKLIGGLLGRVGGGILRGAGSLGAGAALSFATTYALGQVAKRYYAGGRRLDAGALKESFAAMLGEARALQGRYTGAIEQQAKSIDVGKLVAMVKGSPGP
ncbi:MAG: DUF533 domain-containing protein [Betaproteobacteria bacterium]|nr:DUF533 domain-containing protein [Betaproteobacteria bacterium]